MRAHILVFVILASANISHAFAQTAAPPPVQMKIFTSSGAVAALIAKAKADRKDGQALVSEPILQLAPYRANLEYRTASAPAAVHEHEAEMMYVIEGAGTIVTGGRLTDEKRVNPTNLSGTAIEGGTSQAIAKGDFLIVPENTAHQIVPTGGAIVLMTFHVPRPLANP